MAQILFIDDDPMTLQMMSRAVLLLGHQAITAINGIEAVQIASQQLPDIIFTDMVLTDCEGTELISKLRSQESTANIPMFILSASPGTDTIAKAQRAGAQAYLNKPIRLQELLDIIDQYAVKRPM